MAARRRFFQEPHGSYFLFGPRGTGKSTFLKERHPNALFVDLLLPDVYRSYLARPERLLDTVAAHRGDPTIVIDEVQRVPELLPVVHYAIENRPDASRFILAGSSARKLRRSGTDLLAGRLVMRSLHPYMAAELGPDFDLDRALRVGLIPLVVESAAPEDTLAAYGTLYLNEEVKAEGLVRNIGGFARFLESVSFSHTGQLNLSAIARECEVARKTVEGHLSILEDLLLSYQIPVFRRMAKRALALHSKLCLFDAGVFRALRPRGALDRPEDAEGQALEGLVAQHLVAWIAYRARDERLFFWRTKAGLEVDLVVYGESGLVAIEVKNARRVHQTDLRGLRAFREDYPFARCMLLYRGVERLELDGVVCVPCAEFLRSLVPDRLVVGSS